MKYAILITAVLLCVGGAFYAPFEIQWTRTAPAFDETVFDRLTKGTDALLVVEALGYPYCGWLYDRAQSRNEPIRPIPGEHFLNAAQIKANLGAEKLTLFYSTSRTSFLGYRKFVVVFRTGKLAETFVRIED